MPDEDHSTVRFLVAALRSRAETFKAQTQLSQVRASTSDH
jgi:hypothetical protein